MKVKPVTAPRLAEMKQAGERIVCLTAYDMTGALMADAAGVDVILVGDSVGNVVQGHETTLPVTLEQMEYHTRCVAPFSRRALVVADLPFGSYQVSPAQAVESSVRLMKAGAGAVKLEGRDPEAVQAVVRAGIPVMGHLGMTPQSVHAFGGFRVQGRGEEGDEVLHAAQDLESAGAFAVVLELVPASLSGPISAALRIPTIGIGAGPECDGQIQVWHDVLALKEPVFRHAKV
ncbi:MAG: 3-methyl-2-oxobutanoate hydroxymethyltransferase, partial [Fimbriimonadaceae bacterium]|nr:3-methyl-2-oxobutanoate hydroxymethyltransferase [Fimbriimonadaceae bacterium]